jgi:predicted DNA-binding protein (MmcQ/YjbR family)
MTPTELRDFCLSLEQAFESVPFGEETSVFKVSGSGKIFALSAMDGVPLKVSLKVDPEDSISLREEFPQITPGYHLNKKHWVTVDLSGGVPDDLVEDLVRGSHELVRPRRGRSRYTDSVPDDLVGGMVQGVSRPSAPMLPE